MILIDTGVIIEFTRTGDPLLFKMFQENEGAIVGLIRAEVLHGSRNPKHIENPRLALNSFRQLDFPEHLWDQVGINLSQLRLVGINVPFIDVALATFALSQNLPFWTRDKQFLTIQKALPELQFFDETI